MITETEKKLLLKFARQSIAGDFTVPEDVSEDLQKKKGVFVTLKKDGSLRGCIGMIAPVMPLWQAVMRCARDAAFADNRFFAVTIDEIPDITIEISILSESEQLTYDRPEDLLNKLTHEHGVIIKMGAHSATYLPQVWDEIKSKEDFLCSLCMKAGLLPDTWQKSPIEVFTYTVEKFGE